jgi:hypothetical protein
MQPAGLPPYPTWQFYPARTPAPDWVPGVIAAFSAAGAELDSRDHLGVTSDAALAVRRPSLVALGFEIEAGKKASGKIRRLSIGVLAVGEEQAVVDIWAWLGHGMEVTLEVAKYLLTKNKDMRFGKLGVDDEGDIALSARCFRRWSQRNRSPACCAY